jgi:PQQ-like domain
VKLSRSLAVVGGLVLSVVSAVGLASPASAAYSNDPITRAWVPDGSVHSSLSTPSNLIVGGAFFGGGGIAALSPSDGGLMWSAVADGDVRAMALSSDGTTLFVGGGFSHVNGMLHRHLAAINVADGSVLPTWKANAGGMVRDLVVSGDTLFVGGTFAKIGGVTQKGLGAITASTGKLIPQFTNFVNKPVYGLAITDSSLIAVGRFTMVNGGPIRQSIASFDLATYQLNSWAPPRLCSGCDNYWDVLVDGTNAYVATAGSGGNFGAFNLADGSNPWPYVHTDGDVQALGVTGDGLVYIGGHFGQYVGNINNPRTVMAAVNPIDGTVDQDFHPRIYQTYTGVWTIASTPGVLYGGGDFSGVGVGPDQTSNHVPFLVAFAAL